MDSLIAKLKELNEDARIRMANDDTIWVSELTEDVEHWHRYGIYTGEQLEDYLDRCAQKEIDEYEYENDPANW